MARRRKGIEHEDLDLIPIMNMVSILIPFLLLAAQFVHLAVIDSTLPAIGPPQEVEEQDEDDKPPLQLSVAITRQGITVAGADAVLNPEGAEGAPEGEDEGPTIPCKDGSCATVDQYDLDELIRLLHMIKDEYPDDENVILVPDGKVSYEVIVRVMDATREDPAKPNPDGSARLLFPFVVIAGGAM